MHPNAQLIETFYNAFAVRDHAAMTACYQPNVAFSDEVFTLKGKEVGRDVAHAQRGRHRPAGDTPRRAGR